MDVPDKVDASWPSLSRQVVTVAAPNIGTFLLQLVNEQTNVLFLGHSGTDAALAAVGLGNAMQNCIGLSIGWGFLGALDTFVSQAHGAGQKDAACAYFQRGRLIATLQLLWIVPVLMSTETLLVWAGQDKVVAHMAASYNRSTALALFCFFQFQATSKFLQNQCITLPSLVINFSCSMLHVAWCALFVLRLGLGNAGAGYANAMTWTTQWFLISVYVWRAAPRIGFSRRRMLGLQACARQKWGEYLKVAIPCVAQTSSEWWFWEICALVVGFLGTVSLAAHVAALQFVALSFMPAMGISSAAAALVGNALGAGKPQQARRLVVLCIALNLALWTGVACLSHFGRSLIASAYVRQGEVRSTMAGLLSIFALVGFFDTTQHVMCGALRGMGKTVLTSCVYVLSYYGFMLPVGCLFAFRCAMGVRGLWWAFALGTSIASLIFGLALACAPFRQLADRIGKEMQARRVASVETKSSEHP